MIIPTFCEQTTAKKPEPPLPDKEEDEMDTHWLKSLSNLQCQFKGLQEVEKFFESDYQWIDEVVTEATALFKKNNTQSSSQIDNSDEAEVEDAANVSDDVAPVLLPTTPRVIYKISKIFRNVFYRVFPRLNKAVRKGYV